MMECTSGFGWGMGAFGWVFMILFWGLVLVGIIAIVKWLIVTLGSGSEVSQQRSALQILQQRYARGEINREEFAEKKRDLEG